MLDGHKVAHYHHHHSASSIQTSYPCFLPPIPMPVGSSGRYLEAQTHETRRVNNKNVIDIHLSLPCPPNSGVVSPNTHCAAWPGWPVVAQLVKFALSPRWRSLHTPNPLLHRSCRRRHAMCNGYNGGIWHSIWLREAPSHLVMRLRSAIGYRQEWIG